MVNLAVTEVLAITWLRKITSGPDTCTVLLKGTRTFDMLEQQCSLLLPINLLLLVVHRLMPPTMVAPSKVAYALAAYRLALAKALSCAPAAFGSVADAALAAFPGVLDDDAVFGAFKQLWDNKCAELLGPQVC